MNRYYFITALLLIAFLRVNAQTDKQMYSIIIQ